MLDNVRALWWRLAYELLGRQIPFTVLKPPTYGFKMGLRQGVFIFRTAFTRTPLLLLELSVALQLAKFNLTIPSTSGLCHTAVSVYTYSNEANNLQKTYLGMAIILLAFFLLNTVGGAGLGKSGASFQSWNTEGNFSNEKVEIKSLTCATWYNYWFKLKL